MLLPVQAGNLSVANAYGSGLLEAAELSSEWERAVVALTLYGFKVSLGGRPAFGDLLGEN